MHTKIIKRLSASALGAALLLSGTSALPQSAPSYEPTPDRAATEEILLDHIRVLASDEYGGRMPGTDGGRMTQEYMIRALESYGFEPGYQGDWRQAVTLTGQSAATMGLRVGGTEIDGSEMVAFSMPELPGGRRASQLVYIGSSADMPADMAGKTALFPNLETGRGLFGPVVEARAAGAIILIEDASAFARFAGGSGRTQYSLPASSEDDETEPMTAMFGPASRQSLLAALNQTPEELAAMSGQSLGEIEISSTRSAQTIETANVVGILRGTRPGSGAVIMMGHWDHVGTCGEEGDADRICNGAADNASGIAAILETARRIAGGPRPQRDIYMLGTTAEEMGLLGARYFAENPPIPLDQFQAALNVDMISIAPAGTPLSVIGWNQTPMDEPIKITAAGLNRQIEVGDESATYVRRQDGWALMNLGVPAVLVSGGFGADEIFEEFMATRYHRANDEVHDGLELGGAAEDVAVYTVLMMHLANPDRYTKPAGWEFDRGE